MRRQNICNLLSLVSIQASNALIPLVIFPYALTIIGTESYAKLAVTEAVAIAAITFVLYSFEVDGVARVIRLDWKHERSKIAAVFSGVLYIRLFIFSIYSFVALSSVFFLDPLSAHLLVMWLGVPLSYALQSSWLFLAIERNGVLAALTVSSRVLAGVIIFVVVKSPSDVGLIPLIMSLCYLAGALGALSYIIFSFQLRLQRPHLQDLYDLARKGKELFIGNLAVVLYRDCNVVLLGITQSDPAIVSLYSIAEKITKGIQAVTRPLNQLYFPKTLKQLGKNSEPNLASLSKIMRNVLPQFATLTAILCCAGIAYLFSSSLIKQENAFQHYQTIFHLIVLMIPSLFFGTSNYMLGVAGLNYLGERVYMYRAILFTSMTSVICCLILSAQFGAAGAAITLTLSEGLLLLIILRRFSPRPSR